MELKHGESTLARQLFRAKTENTWLYDQYFQRIYDVPSKFSDWRLPLFFGIITEQFFLSRYRSYKTMPPPKKMIINPLTGQEMEQTVDLPENFYIEGNIAIKMKKYGCPLFFVAPEIMTACLATEPPQDIQVAELNLPYEGFSFVFPEDSLRRNGLPVHFVNVAIERKGIYQAQLGGVDITTESLDDALLVSTLDPVNFETLTFRINQDTINNLKSIDYKEEWVVIEHGVPVSRGESGTANKEDDLFAELFLGLIINLLLVMEARPTLVERQAKIKTLRRDRSKEVWSPNIIGRKYRILESESGNPPQGTHASPRMHFRRGHYRNTPIGPRKTTCECGHGVKYHVNEDGLSYCLAPKCNCIKYTIIPDERRGFIRQWIDPVLVGKS